MNTFRTFLLIAFFNGLSICAFSQDVPAKIDAFNAAIGKQYNVSNKGNKLIIEGFREGKQVKVDKVNVFDLDLKTLKFSEKDRAVSIKCYSDIDGCVNRVLLLNKKKSYRQRVVFAVPENVSGEEIVNKLKILLNEMIKKR
ncbi:MAG: hypothetical protein JKX84_03675 [Flavobacteriales bacterium]|nr:hypothetical protein [Flavobacteriales bacterium]